MITKAYTISMGIVIFSTLSFFTFFLFVRSKLKRDNDIYQLIYLVFCLAANKYVIDVLAINNPISGVISYCIVMSALVILFIPRDMM
jgi:hypothetical protein